MDAIRKQASKLREQVAKQQQALLRQLGHFSTDTILADESELQCHQQLQNLYSSTRAAKHFQKNIVRGVEGFISLSSKQMAIVRRLADDCRKYGVDNQSSGTALATAVLNFSKTHNSIEDERETLLRILGDQVCEPLRAQITGAPLEDARHLSHRYDKLRQEVEIQAAEVLRRRSKSRDSSISAESAMRLQNAEDRLTELKSTIAALGRETTAAMQSVEAQQQQVTYQRLLTMVDAERCYHQNALTNLERLNDELILLTKSNGFLSQSTIKNGEENSRAIASKDTKPKESDAHLPGDENNLHFVAKVIHPFDAQAEGELSLSVDDYVVVHQVWPNGWSEGECKGKCGWFPSAYVEAYVERQEKIPVSNLHELQSSPSLPHS